MIMFEDVFPFLIQEEILYEAFKYYFKISIWRLNFYPKSLQNNKHELKFKTEQLQDQKFSLDFFSFLDLHTVRKPLMLFPLYF